MASVLYREATKDTLEDAETVELDGVLCEVGRFRASDVAGRLGSGWFGWPRPKDEPVLNAATATASLDDKAKGNKYKGKL